MRRRASNRLVLALLAFSAVWCASPPAARASDPALLATDAPFPSANDVPFLPGFPYLAPPHRP